MPQGPLAGLKVVELIGLAPSPFATMILADLGAEVIRIDRARPTFDVIGGWPALQTIQIRRRRPTPVVAMAATERRSAGGTWNDNSDPGPRPAARSPQPAARGLRSAACFSFNRFRPAARGPRPADSG